MAIEIFLISFSLKRRIENFMDKTLRNSQNTEVSEALSCTT